VAQSNQFKESYDVIIAGGGVGGLSAALELAHQGVSVLLLEQNPVVGGYVTSFVRGRYEFEFCIRGFGEYGDGKNGHTYGEVRQFLDTCGVKVDVKDVTNVYRVLLSKYKLDFTMPFGVENVIAAIEKLEPGQGPKVRNYFKLCEEIYDALMYINASNMKPSPLLMATKYSAILRTSAYSVNEVFDALGFSPLVKELMGLLSIGITRSMDVMSFMVYAIMVYVYIKDGVYIINKTSHSLVVDMEERIRELGGQIETGVRVERLLTEKGTVVGVKTAEGDEIRARRVLCNFSPNTVYTKMMDEKDVPERALKLTGARPLGASMVNVFLGLDALPQDMGITDYGYLLAQDLDFKRLYPETREWKPSSLVSCFCLDVAAPGYTGPDRCQMSFTSLFDPGAMTGHTDPLHYMETKEAFANAAIDLFEDQTGARIRDHIEEIEVCTPASYARYAGTPKGNVYGYEITPIDGIAPRLLAIDKEQYIPGLDFVGAYGRRAHSCCSSMMNGHETALNTIKKLGEMKNG
jgi:prolycopene isomerase